MGRATIWQERNNEGVRRYSVCFSKLRQYRHCSTSGIADCAFRIGSRRIYYQRAIFHRAARSRTKAATLQASLRVVCFFGFLAFAWRQQSVRTRCLDSCRPPRSCSRSRRFQQPCVVLLQPKRQPPAIQIDTLIDSSNRTALLKKTHRWKSTLSAIFCRGSNSHQNRHQNPALL